VTPSPTGLLTRLADAGVDFVVIGGIAVVAHGHIRTTRDLDITYGTTPENLETLGRALVALDARLRGVAEVVPFIPDGRTLRGAELLTLETSLGSLDLLAKPPGAPAYPALKMGAEPIELDGREVLIASIEDLIAMKRAAGRPRDLDDIEALEEIRRIRGESFSARG
jgi:nucleotidyltransferase AbiEii toxin of type IV toxin-antitoxin system